MDEDTYEHIKGLKERVKGLEERVTFIEHLLMEKRIKT